MMLASLKPPYKLGYWLLQTDYCQLDTGAPKLAQPRAE